MTLEKFTLSWNQFDSSATNTFKYLLTDNNFTDVTLACEDDKQINAHKVILSSCSTFFEKILLKNPHRNPLIYLKGLKFTDLQDIMSFIYLGEVEVAQEDLERFIRTGKDLDIKGLTENYYDNEK